MTQRWVSGHCLSEADATEAGAPVYHSKCKGAYPWGANRSLLLCACPAHEGELRCHLCDHRHTDPADYDEYQRQCADLTACAGRLEHAEQVSASSPLRQMIAELKTAATTPAPTRTRAGKAPRDCECGCGGMTRGGRFIPGHDAKLKSVLLRRAADGDTAARDDLRRRGWERK